MATLDEMETTAGSWALVGAKVPGDATVVQKLRAAGAIILGKTSITQWANFRYLNASNGWSALGGQVYGRQFKWKRSGIHVIVSSTCQRSH
ncbi:hypothetical protein F4801DRAFT_546912 [Xylaria longipes]|nr:hypothetical protein F4801DRAFT_546912 [Xylaria longipes]